MEAKIADWKKKEVENIKRLINEYGIFGVVDMTNLPSLQLQRLKKNLKGLVLIRMSKKRLIKIALDEMKKENFDKVKEKVKGMPAIIFTKEDPFKLANILKRNKSSAPAKAGQIAPNDIYVKAGPTPFAPGPIIGELGQLGIKTEVKEGKVAVKDDKLLVEEGDTINSKQADLLSKLKIEPMKIGLNLLMTYQDGEILTKDILEIDEEAYIETLKMASQEGLNLAIGIGYITKDTISFLIKKAVNEGGVLESLEKVKDVMKKEEEPKEKPEDKKEEPAKREKREEEKKEKPGAGEKPKEEKTEEKKEEEKPKIEKKEKVIKDEEKPTAEELIKEAEKTPENKEEKEEKEKKMMKDVEEFTKKVMWGEKGRGE